jgi:hypothetical protein
VVAPDDEAGQDREGEETRGAEARDVPWARIVQELKARRPAVAAVYEDARFEGFDGTVLHLSFPEDLAIYVKLAGEPKRLDPLREVLEEHLGTTPRLEFRIADGARDGPTPVPAEPPDISLEVEERRQANGPESSEEGPVGRATDPAEVGGVAPGTSAHAGGAEAGGRIGSESEVFEMARQRGLFGKDGGS